MVELLLLSFREVRNARKLQLLLQLNWADHYLEFANFALQLENYIDTIQHACAFNARH